MKGPRARQGQRVYRTWCCPVCQKQLLRSAQFVNVACSCGADPERPQWMCLVEPMRKYRKPFHDPAPAPLPAPEASA